MPATAKHVYGRYTREAVILLGRLVAAGRRERKMTAASLAERVGVSRGTLQRLERGDPKVEIGVFFEAAAIVGVALFDSDAAGLRGKNERLAERLALLPRHVHEPKVKIDDDF